MTESFGLVDFHCHLDLYPAPAAMFRDSEAAGVFTVAVTTTPKAWPQNQLWAKGMRHVHPALGLHPQLVAEHASELSIWDAHLAEARFVGEVGLDASPRFYGSFELQKRTFEHILKKCSAVGERILSVHSTRAATITLDMIEAFLPPGRGRVVLHWFGGDRKDIARATRLGCFFSVNAQMLTTARARELVGALPLDRLLTETDGPFAKGEGAAKPSDLAYLVKSLGKLRGLGTPELAGHIQMNLRDLLSGQSLN